MFNDVEHVRVEFYILSQRYQMPSASAAVGSLAFGVILCFVVSPWLGVPVIASLLTAVVYLNWRLNQMNIDGFLRETTQIKLYLGTAWKPRTRNYRRR
ncbi:hypothetical protein BKG86_21470 [Mycobacteroides chelonae]|nr:hypothetical protein BKG86_21470 [Mycobacteroides chelonae]